MNDWLYSIIYLARYWLQALTIECILPTCTLKFIFWAKAFPQNLQVWSLVFSWILFTCILKLPFWVKDFSQCKHLNETNFKCTSLKCFFAACIEEYDLLQSRHFTKLPSIGISFFSQLFSLIPEWMLITCLFKWLFCVKNFSQYNHLVWVVSIQDFQLKDRRISCL